VIIVDEKQIEKQAKEIMDNFFSVLSKVKEIEKEEKGEEAIRDAKIEKSNEEFRSLFFNIAVKKDGDFFIAEKAKWK